MAPATLTVNTTADNTSNTTVPEALRDAITLANRQRRSNSQLAAGPIHDARQKLGGGQINTTNPFGTSDTIDFNITAASDTGGDYNATTGVATLSPLSPLGNITASMMIDGYTQPGAQVNTLASGDNAVLKIVLNGSQAGSYDGLDLSGGGSTVRGLVINNFSGFGIGVFSNDNIIEGNFIGTDVTGEQAQGNRNHGVEIGKFANPGPGAPSNFNRIGTYGDEVDDFADRNIHFGQQRQRHSHASYCLSVSVSWGKIL